VNVGSQPGIISSFELPVSQSLDDIKKAAQVALDNINQREFSLKMTAKEVDLNKQFLDGEYHCRRQQLERQEAASACFFKDNPLASYIKDELVVPLIELGQGKRENVDSLLEPLPRGTALTEEIKEVIASAEHAYNEPFSAMSRTMVVVREINYALEDASQSIRLIRIDGVQKTEDRNTFGIAQVIQKGFWQDGESMVDFYFLDVMFPTRLTLRPAGSHDSNLAISWVNTTTFFNEAVLAFARKEGRMSTAGGFENLVKIAGRHDSVESLANAMAQDALVEEVRHQMNFNRSCCLGERLHQRYPRFFHERVAKGHWLADFWRLCQYDSDRYQLARAVEEVESKLVSVAASPDSLLSVALMDPLLKRAFLGARQLPTEWEIIAALLNGVHVTRVTQDAFADIFGLTREEVRTRAMKALKETFREDLENTPFCSVDERGVLHRTNKTHAMFAGWAQKDDRSWLQKIKSSFVDWLSG